MFFLAAIVDLRGENLRPVLTSTGEVDASIAGDARERPARPKTRCVLRGSRLLLSCAVAARGLSEWVAQRAETGGPLGAGALRTPISSDTVAVSSSLSGVGPACRGLWCLVVSFVMAVEVETFEANTRMRVVYGGETIESRQEF